MSGIHPVPDSERPAIPPTLPAVEETGPADRIIAPATSHPESVSGRMMEYVSHAIFIVVALMVMDWLHHSQLPSVQVGHRPHSIPGDRPIQEIPILEQLKKKFL
ncbi:hypothetical protein [Lyngbya sp. CCY1209]|uniref:hypothetical protein n=1 Tax=Lyngbya sp. CCY1209 TaxID=2886103 RepID=UPI002D217E4D|nr:hypothetical protein [Lyngbya sp. CCY1209]MEB3883982.1 hypothetical protein [Lyngbya sp. CCY1209]